MKITRKVKLDKTTKGELFEVTKFNQLSDIILKENYSLSTFENNIVKNENFINCNSIGLDFDGGFSLKSALVTFSNVKCIISTTKSHRKEKNGKIDDRFRVIIFLKEPITNIESFKLTYNQLKEIYPEIDKQCSNPSRWFYPSKKIVAINKQGKLFDIVKVSKMKSKDFATVDTLLTLKGHGKLSKTTRRFLKQGLTPGSRNGDTFKIAKDFQENGFTLDEAKTYIKRAFESTETLTFDFTDFEVDQTIESAYNSQPTNEPRTPFKLMPIGELYKIKTKLEWVVDRLLSRGGVSLMSAVPKAGKSQIARQLIKSVATGTKFFGRNTIKGEVHYYAIEEQAEVINQSFKKIGLPSDVNLFVHIGDIFSENKLKDLHQVLKERKPALVVIDTLFDVLDVESENNYKEVKKELRRLREIARDCDTHILCIHHANKSISGVTGSHRGVLGSQAIVGGVDVIMLIEMNGDMRVLTTMGRSIKKWTMRELIWDDETELYRLGKKAVIDEF